MARRWTGRRHAAPRPAVGAAAPAAAASSSSSTLVEASAQLGDGAEHLDPLLALAVHRLLQLFEVVHARIAPGRRRRGSCCRGRRTTVTHSFHPTLQLGNLGR